MIENPHHVIFIERTIATLLFRKKKKDKITTTMVWEFVRNEKVGHIQTDRRTEKKRHKKSPPSGDAKFRRRHAMQQQQQIVYALRDRVHPTFERYERSRHVQCSSNGRGQAHRDAIRDISERK